MTPLGMLVAASKPSVWFVWQVADSTMFSDVVQESWNWLLDVRGWQWHVGCKLQRRQHQN